MLLACRRRARAPRRRVDAGAVALVAVAVVVAFAASACLTAPGGLVNGFLPASDLRRSTRTVRSGSRPRQPRQHDRRGAQPGRAAQPRECYRTYAQQVAERNYWCSLGLCQFAAVPGTSVHGWGKAVDFQTRTAA